MQPADSLQDRQEKLATTILNSGLGGFILNPGPSLHYLTGLHFHLSERPVVVFFIPGKPVRIVLPELETAKVQNLPYPARVYPYNEDPDTWVDAFRQAGRQSNIENPKIGVEPRGLRFLELQLLQEANPDLDFVPAESVTAALRMVKDAPEIASMQQAARIAEQALTAILPQIKIGMSEAEVAAALSMQLLNKGSNPQLPFFPIVSSGANSANPHAVPSDRLLASGDLLVIDYGANVDGYFSDITRTFAIGEVDPEYHKIARIVLAANKAGCEAVKPGVTAGSVDHAARSVIEKAGYGEFFIHRTGHGLGLEGHEEPYIRGGSDLILEVGMTFTIEPGIYLPGRNGVRIEDDVLVTSQGVRSLTSLQRELVTLPIIQ